MLLQYWQVDLREKKATVQVGKHIIPFSLRSVSLDSCSSREVLLTIDEPSNFNFHYEDSLPTSAKTELIMLGDFLRRSIVSRGLVICLFPNRNSWMEDGSLVSFTVDTTLSRHPVHRGLRTPPRGVDPNSSTRRDRPIR